MVTTFSADDVRPNIGPDAVYASIARSVLNDIDISHKWLWYEWPLSLTSDLMETMCNEFKAM
jgi:hypothetical protein